MLNLIVVFRDSESERNAKRIKNALRLNAFCLTTDTKMQKRMGSEVTYRVSSAADCKSECFLIVSCVTVLVRYSIVRKRLSRKCVIERRGFYNALTSDGFLPQLCCIPKDANLLENRVYQNTRLAAKYFW